MAPIIPRASKYGDCDSGVGVVTIFFEDMRPGIRVELGDAELSADEIIEFARRYDPQSFHLSEEGGRASQYGGLIASGWQVCGMVMRLMVDNWLKDVAAQGSPGVEHLSWMRPVRPGDRLSAMMEIQEVVPSRSRTDRGRVRVLLAVNDKQARPVMTFTAWLLIMRRPSPEATA